MFTLLDNIYSSGWLIFVILFFKALLLGNACSVELLSISFDSEARYASYCGPQCLHVASVTDTQAGKESLF